MPEAASFAKLPESLLTPISEEWNPPSPWDSAGKSWDQRHWIERLATLGLCSKATNGFTCGYYFIRVADGSHCVRLGRVTCGEKSCRNCGTGAMRIHRLSRSDPKRFAVIIGQDCRTLRLVVSYAEPADSLADYIARIRHDRRYLRALRRKMRREFGQSEHGYMMSVELDPAHRDVIFRVYYAGYDPGHRWFSREWLLIVGLQAACTSKYHSEEKAADALRWMLDSYVPMLMLDGRSRAEWEHALDGYRLTSCVGSLRGAAIDDKAAEEEDDDRYGRCPCGCGEKLRKPDDHTPHPLEWFQERYKIVEFGSLCHYGAYRGKVNAPGHRIPEFRQPASIFRSPPPS